MDLIIIAVVLYIVFRIIKKIKSKKEEAAGPQAFTPPAPGSRAEKKAIKYFESDLKIASGEYGDRAISAMKRVADDYALGDGVEKNIEKAKEWAERAFRATLQQKIEFSETSGASPHYPSMHMFSFFTNGKYIPADYDKALELALQLSLTGTIAAKEIISEIVALKYPDKKDQIDVDFLIADYPCYCSAITARSKKKYREYAEEMKASGITGQTEIIEWLLKKADWNVSVSETNFPGVTAENDRQFHEARAIEAAGQDFNKAAAAYEAPAAAGHTEAMRRLGLIKRNILSENDLSNDFTAGTEWLKKAAEAGNALAAFDLGEKNPNVAFIAGLAASWYPDALFALGCMLEKGLGGQANHDVAQSVFRLMETKLGDPIAKKDGEGIEWLRKLGEKFRIIDDRYFIRLADAGCAIGYMPSQTELLYISHEMMRRAYEKSGDKVGEYGDFGYTSYIIELAKAPCRAGIAKAKAISRAMRREQSDFQTWRTRNLNDAERGTGDYQNTFWLKFSPAERLSRAAVSMHKSNSLPMLYTRLQKGLNFSEIHTKIFESGDFNADVEAVLNKLTENSQPQAAAPSDGRIPSIITDDQGREWYYEGPVLGGVRYRLLEGSYFNPEWDLGDSITGTTAIISDAEIQKGSGKTIGRTFHW